MYFHMFDLVSIYLAFSICMARAPCYLECDLVGIVSSYDLVGISSSYDLDSIVSGVRRVRRVRQMMSNCMVWFGMSDRLWESYIWNCTRY